MSSLLVNVPFAFFAPAILDVKTEQIGGILRVEWRRKSVNLEKQSLSFSDGVVATYGVTSITADKLTIFLKEGEEHAVAEGGVRVTDPEGQLLADRYEFSWRTQSGSAKNVIVQIQNLTAKVGQVQVEPKRWELTNVVALPTHEKNPSYKFSSPSVVIRPEKDLVAKKLKIEVFGAHLTTLGSYRSGLSQSEAGFKMPSISYRQGNGFGVTWSGVYPLGDRTFLRGGFTSFPERRPGYSLGIAQNLIRNGSDAVPVTPRSELSELFSFSYMDNISVKDPLAEERFLTKPRLYASLGTAWNLSAGGNLPGGRISKPWDVAIETGGSAKGFGIVLQGRIQRIGQNKGTYQTRGITSASLGVPKYKLGNFESNIRFDTRTYFNEQSTMNWLRAQFGMIWNIHPKVRLGAAYLSARQTGSPAFPFDELTTRNGFHIRGDFDLGPTQLSILAKYDASKRKWIDHEYFFSQVVGSFEPYVVWRQDPRRFNFGIQLRALEIFDQLGERLKQRTPENEVKKAP